MFATYVRTALSTLLLATGFSSVMAADLSKIGHIIIIYEENRSFDNLYGRFPGAEGLAQAGKAAIQVDRDGKVYAHLPQPLDTNQKDDPVTHQAPPDPRFPADIPNGWFDAGRYVKMTDLTGDLWHRFYQEQLQIDGGRMDKFAAWSDAAGLTMGVYDGRGLALYKLAQEFTLADHFFHGAFGSSFLNHIYFVCVCAPVFPNAPDSMVAQLDEKGNLIKDGSVTPDFYAVNTVYSVNQPHPARTKPDHLMPPQDAPTIGDRLSAKGVSWAWYSGGFADAVAGKPDPLFQFHHQPFAYFRNYGDGTPGRAAHLKDGSEFLRDVDAGTLPAVSFYKPIGKLNLHPGYSTIIDGDSHAAAVIDWIRHSRIWADTVIIVTHDENGGTWDHMAPPKGDRWGPGTRVPAIIISPFAKRHHVDHTVYNTASILALIEHRFGLEPLGERDAKAADLTAALTLN